MRSVIVVGLLLALTACAKPPSQTQNACAIFEQRDGLFNNWRRAAQKTEREYGVPVPILMATIYTESGFRHNAKPPRTKLLGFIPWKRKSSAYGYSQALDGTWDRYQRETGRWGARRTYVIGVSLFAVTLLVCGFAPSIGTLIAARCGQGLAAVFERVA